MLPERMVWTPPSRQGKQLHLRRITQRVSRYIECIVSLVLTGAQHKNFVLAYIWRGTLDTWQMTSMPPVGASHDTPDFSGPSPVGTFDHAQVLTHLQLLSPESLALICKNELREAWPT